MAPALTDATAHSANFKLPASPANPGFDSLYSLSSPDLPDKLPLNITPVLSTKQSLTDEIQTFERIVSASVPGRELVSKNGLNGCSHGYFHLENLTQLMKSKDTKSVIELLSGINGHLNNTRRDSADLRFKMNGTDPALSEKVKRADNGDGILSLSDRLNSGEHGCVNTDAKATAGEEIFKNDPDPFMVVENSDNLSTGNNPRTDFCEDMVVDSDLPMQLNAEPPSQSSNTSCPKDSFSFEEKVLTAAEDLLSAIAESSPPKASEFLEDEVELPVLCTASLEDAYSRQQTLRDRSTRLIDRLRKLQFAQVGVHTKDEISWFASRVQKDDASVSSNDCLICKQRKLCRSDSTAFVPCDKHIVPNSSRTEKQEPPPTLSQRIITRGDGKEVFRNIENTHRRLQHDLIHLQDKVDDEATESSSDESDEESEFKMTYQEGPNKRYSRLSLNRRAIWKWAQHRAGVARRWTWLQAQVSDLEYRIRQHSDIYRQIKASKGAVTLDSQERHHHPAGLKAGSRRLSQGESKLDRLEGDDHTVSPSSLSSVLSNVDHQSARLHKSLSNCLTPSTSGGKPTLQLNGCVHSRSSSSSNTAQKQNHRTFPPVLPRSESPVEIHCARTRPVRYYRKRRLVRVRDIGQFGPKARSLSSTRCGCCPPSMCVMCGGRFNRSKPLNPYSMPTAEKVSYLSPGFHPVLSFPDDIPLPVHFESLLSRGDNGRRHKQQKRQVHATGEGASTTRRLKPAGTQLKGKKRNLKNLQKLRNKGNLATPNNLPRGQVFYKKLNHLRNKRDIRVLSRSQSDSVTLLPNPTDTTTNTEEVLRRCRTEVKRRRSQAYSEERKSRERSSSLPILDHPPTGRTPPESKAQTPTTQFGFSLPDKKSMPGDAYDIDNIVIPYSMLASTRVEKLHYKEIDTPQWRLVANGMMADLDHVMEEEVVKEQVVNEEESLSDAEFTQRHLRYEIKEKKKFLAILANQGAAALAAGRRSRTRNNSTASNPDPLSPSLPSSQNYSLSGSFDALSPLSPSPLPSPPAAREPAEPVTPRQLRSGSTESRRTSFSSDKSTSLDEPIQQQGWSRRSFPLDDDQVTEMTKEQELTDALYYQSPASGSVRLGLDSDEESFGSEQDPEDPNDPEWTVVTKRKPQRSDYPTDDDPLVLHLKCAVKEKESTPVREKEDTPTKEATPIREQEATPTVQPPESS